jgi:hypothetical protein
MLRELTLEVLRKDVRERGYSPPVDLLDEALQA